MPNDKGDGVQYFLQVSHMGVETKSVEHETVEVP